MSNRSSFFDIRPQAPYQEGNPLTRNEYNNALQVLNRTILLMGDVSLRELYTIPLSQLAKHLAANVPDAVRFGLLSDAASVTPPLEVLATMSGITLTLDGLMDSDPLLLRASIALRVLRSQGILLPNFAKDGAAKRAAVKRLLATPVAPEWTYGELFTRPRTELEATPEALCAIRKLLRVSALETEANGMCCLKGHCVTGDPTDFCVPGPDGLCAGGAVQCIATE